MKGLFGWTLRDGYVETDYPYRDPNPAEVTDIFAHLATAIKNQEKLLMAPESPEEELWRKIVENAKKEEVGCVCMICRYQFIALYSKKLIYHLMTCGEHIWVLNDIAKQNPSFMCRSQSKRYRG